MTIAELRAYRKNEETIEFIDFQLEKNAVVTVTQGSAGPPTYKKRTHKEYGHIHGKETVNLKDKKSLLESKNRDIEGFIKLIPKKPVRDALIYYCLNLDVYNPSWQETADAIKYKGDGEALRKFVTRYLENFKNVR